MPKLYEVCSRCGNNWMACHCDSFAPPVKVTLEEMNAKQMFMLSRQECEYLLEFFMRVGYIGFEFEWDIETHKVINKLQKFLGVRK